MSIFRFLYKIVSFSLLILSIAFADQPIKGISQYRRLILIPDVDKKSDAVLTTDLMMAGIMQSAPIIITAALFKEYLDVKKTTLNKINNHPVYYDEVKELDILIRTLTNQPEQKIKEFSFKYNLLVQWQFFFLDSDWYLFDVPNSSLLLLVPKRYLQQVTGSSQLNSIQQTGEKLGFFLDGKQIPLPSQNITQVDQLTAFEDNFSAITKTKPKEFKPEHLKKVLRPTPLVDDTYVYSWNIFSIGHGTPAEPIIMGMNADEFEQLLTLFNTHVHTNFFYYVTCYGGSEESLGKPYLKFKRLKDLNYVVVSGSTTDAPVQISWFNASSPKMIVVNGVLIPKPELSFNDFFNYLEQQGMFEKALKAMTASLSKNVPLIRFPGTDAFNASKLENSVAIITKVKNLTSLVDNKEFIIQDKIALIVYPQVVATPINFNNDKPIEMIFMHPPSDHYFAQFKVKNINNFFSTGIHTKTSYFHNAKSVYIDKLLFPSLFIDDNKKEAAITIKLEDKDKPYVYSDITNLFAKNGEIVLPHVIIQFGGPASQTMLGAALPEIYIKLPGATILDDRFFKGYFSSPHFNFKELSEDDRQNQPVIAMIEKKRFFFKTQKQELEKNAETIRKSGFLQRKHN